MKTLFVRFVVLLGLALAPFTARADLIVSENNPYGTGTEGILRGSDFGGPLTPWIPLGRGGLDQPVGMRINPLTGNLLIASKGTGDVKEYNAITGDYIGNFASGIEQPANIQISPDNSKILVSQFGGNGVSVFNTDGTPASPYSSLSDDGLLGASSILYSGSQIFVTSFNNARVYSFDAATGATNGIFAQNLGEPGNTLVTPSGLAIRGNELFVANLFGHNILKFDATTGEFIGEYVAFPDLIIPDDDDPDVEIPLPAYPAQLDFLQDGSLLISLTGQGVVGYVDPTGSYLGPYAYGGGLQVPGEFAFVAPIPEPGTLAGLSMAGIGLLWHFRRRKSAVAVS